MQSLLRSLRLRSMPMAWTVLIRRADRAPLGSRDALRPVFLARLPGLAFYREPSGPEKLAATKIAYPEVIRKHFESAPAEVRADFASGDLHLRFFFGPEGQDQIDSVAVEVRGGVEPAPVLLALCAPDGWGAEEPDGARLHLAGPAVEPSPQARRPGGAPGRRHPR